MVNVNRIFLTALVFDEEKNKSHIIDNPAVK